VKTKLFYCLICNSGGSTTQQIAHIGCTAPFYIVEAEVNFKMQKTRWGRLLDWLLEDPNYALAFLGGVIINAILIPHFHLSLGETIVESTSWGFLLIRLLKA
jgi:hypothetical protein